MSDAYNTAAERLLQYITGHASLFVGHEPDWKKPFPYDQVAKFVPFIKDIVKGVQDELNYELSEAQGSWAVHIHYRFGLDKYNAENDLNLKPLIMKDSPNEHKR